MQNKGLIVADEAVRIAVGYIGNKEEPAGSNAGPFVEACLKTVGLGKGFPWCAAFTYRVFSEACKLAGVANFLPRTGHVLTCWRDVAAERKILAKNATRATVKSGYLGIMNYGGGKGHIFIVESVSVTDKGLIFHTIEGNTDAGGSRTGGMVCRQTRYLMDKRVTGFIRA